MDNISEKIEIAESRLNTSANIADAAEADALHDDENIEMDCESSILKDGERDGTAPIDEVASNIETVVDVQATAPIDESASNIETFVDVQANGSPILKDGERDGIAPFDESASNIETFVDVKVTAPIDEVTSIIETFVDVQTNGSLKDGTRVTTEYPSLESETSNDYQTIEKVSNTEKIACHEEDLKNEENTCRTVPVANALGSLGLITQYESDESSSEMESSTTLVTETNAIKSQCAYRNKSNEADANSDSDSSDSSSSDYLECIREEIKRETATPTLNGKGKKQETRNKNDQMFPEDLPPVENLEITVPEDECKLLGYVESFVEQLVIIKVLPKSQCLDLDTVLFLDKGSRALGQVFEVFGPINDPQYCVRFNSQEHISEYGVKLGDEVYYAPQNECTQYIIIEKLRNMTFTDASWEHDEEAPSECLEYSDDEQERIAKRNKRPVKRNNAHVEQNRSDDQPTTSQQRYKDFNSNAPKSYSAADHSNTALPSPSAAPMPTYPQPYFTPDSWHSNYNYYYYNAAQNNVGMPPPIAPPYGMPIPPPIYGMSMYNMYPPYNANAAPPNRFAIPPPTQDQQYPSQPTQPSSKSKQKWRRNR